MSLSVLFWLLSPVMFSVEVSISELVKFLIQEGFLNISSFLFIKTCNSEEVVVSNSKEVELLVCLLCLAFAIALSSCVLSKSSISDR